MVVCVPSKLRRMKMEGVISSNLKDIIFIPIQFPRSFNLMVLDYVFIEKL
jgi:hypothetical protein